MFEKDDEVLVTAQVLRKNKATGTPETLNLADEPGTVKRADVYEDAPRKNTYYVETQYGVHVLNQTKLKAKPA